MLIKEIFDKIFSLIAIIILIPLFLLVSILIKFDSEGPVFFIQERVGKDGKPFKAFKFRTMYVDAPSKTKGRYILKDDPNITKIGKILRRTGIDELPQLINVLKGDMSLVGLRPTLRYQVEKYDDYQRKRLLMKPGITGWALINGRNKLTWPERIKLDVWYVENWSFWLDIKILLKTIWVVVSGNGLYSEVSSDEITKREDEDG